MEEISIKTLMAIMVGLIFLSAFFSGSETGIMTLNPYRLRHLSKTKASARLTQNLLKRPDRLLGIILLGNCFANILAAALATLIAERMGMSVILSSFLLTGVILVFAEVSPKTLAVTHPEPIAFYSVYILKFLLWVLYPAVWLVNMFSNGMLKVFGVSGDKKNTHHLSSDELRTIVHETTGRISKQHRDMLLGILDLEKVSIEAIMVPRNELIGIDLSGTDKELQNQLASTQHTFLPVYEDDLDNIIGILHTRSALNILAEENFSKEEFKKILSPPYYVPEGTSLTKQLFQFKEHKQRFALVVNEYGDIQGLITLEDILEEVVGEFTTDMATVSKDIHPQEDGSFMVDGSATIRDLNRSMGWNFPTEGASTLSGLIIDYLETIPEMGTCCLISHIPIEVVQVIDNKIKTARLSPPLSTKDE